jgi:nucleoside-diphosphate-sugar epimerase
VKEILITGINSYVGMSVEKWLVSYGESNLIDTISLRDNSWKNTDFSKYDVIIHVAGIAHVSSDPDLEQLYYKVNRDLTIETAKKAKKEGVKQFIFLSSIIVYGEGENAKGIINKKTVPKPTNFYGNSKLEAEFGIKALENNAFKVVILRPPMIYGKGSKGNYQTLSKAAKKLLVFPDIKNQRSMIHIDNLCEFIRLIIENEDSGTFFPQNDEYVCTSEMVELISQVNSKRVILTKIFNPILNLIGSKIGIINKVFGDLFYEQGMSEYKVKYQIRNLRDSIELTELERDN